MKRSKRHLREVLDRQLAFEWHPSTTVSTAEAAALLGVSQDMVLKLIHGGLLESRRRSRLRRSRLLVYVDSIEAYADHLRRMCAAPLPASPGDASVAPPQI